VGLSHKQAAFVTEYLADFNATRAAERAGYKGDENTLAVTGHRLLRIDKIADAISKRLSEKAMGADEVLMRLAQHARSDLGPWLSDDGAIDIAAMKEAGTTHLIRKVKRTERSGESKDGGFWSQVTGEVELHDAQAALVQLGKHHKLFVDRTEHTGKDGGPIEVDDSYTDAERAARILKLLRSANETTD